MDHWSFRSVWVPGSDMWVALSKWILRLEHVHDSPHSSVITMRVDALCSTVNSEYNSLSSLLDILRHKQLTQNEVAKLWSPRPTWKRSLKSLQSLQTTRGKRAHDHSLHVQVHVAFHAGKCTFALCSARIRTRCVVVCNIKSKLLDVLHFGITACKTCRHRQHGCHHIYQSHIASSYLSCLCRDLHCTFFKSYKNEKDMLWSVRAPTPA